VTRPDVRLVKRHPITGREPSYRDWWFEHEKVVFHLSADWLRSTVWAIEPDTDHVVGSRELLDFVRSDAYWCAVALGLKDARVKLGEFVASEGFARLRDAYTELPVDVMHRQVAWDPASPVRFYRDRPRGTTKAPEVP
jgi:hypothetical protein